MSQSCADRSPTQSGARPALAISEMASARNEDTRLGQRDVSAPYASASAHRQAVRGGETRSPPPPRCSRCGTSTGSILLRLRKLKRPRTRLSRITHAPGARLIVASPHAPRCAPLFHAHQAHAWSCQFAGSSVLLAHRARRPGDRQARPPLGRPPAHL